MAYDWISDLLYFTLFDQKRIELVRIFYDQSTYDRYSGKYTIPNLRHAVITTKLSPRKIVVHPGRGYLFWTEYEDALCSIRRKQ